MSGTHDIAGSTETLWNAAPGGVSKRAFLQSEQVLGLPNAHRFPSRLSPVTTVTRAFISTSPICFSCLRGPQDISIWSNHEPIMLRRIAVIAYFGHCKAIDSI